MSGDVRMRIRKSELKAIIMEVLNEKEINEAHDITNQKAKTQNRKRTTKKTQREPNKNV